MTPPKALRSADRLPKRVQRKRTKGYRLPPGAVYVGRPSRWGNPFRVGRLYTLPSGDRPLDPETARALFAIWLRDNDVDGWLADLLQPLRGHDLACWCPLEDDDGNRVPCHADVLLELANR